MITLSDRPATGLERRSSVRDRAQARALDAAHRRDNDAHQAVVDADEQDREELAALRRWAA